jgi:O-antigen/teichoic acid export membrane protein
MRKAMAFSLREAINIFQLLLIRGTGMLSFFLVNVLIARNFGPATQGIFQIGLGWVIVAATIGRFGQDQLMLRTAAECKAKNDICKVQRNLVASLALSIGALVLITVLTIVFIHWGSINGKSTDGTIFLSIMILAILPTGTLVIITETLRGWQKINLSIAWQGSLPQTALLVALAVIVFTIQNVNQTWVAFLYAMIFLLATVFAMKSWLKISGLKVSMPIRSELIQVSRSGFHFWLYGVLIYLVAWVDILILGYLDGPETVGRYAAVVRTGAILSAIAQICSTGSVARLAMLYAKGDFFAFTLIARSYFLVFAAASLPIAIILWIFPKEIMHIWGPQFVQSAPLLVIYGLFQLYQFVIGMSGSLVAVIGLEKKIAAIQAFNLVLKFGMIYIGHSLAGITGVVWASALSLFISNNVLLYVFFVKMREHGVQPLNFVFGVKPHD